MTQFHEGQEVEVRGEVDGDYAGDLTEMPWRKAKIVARPDGSSEHARTKSGQAFYRVQFSDGTRALFDATHIRATIMDQMEEAHHTWP